MLTINHSLIGDIITPGVGDYEIDNINLNKKAPKCTIGNYKRFVSTDKGQDYLKTTPVGYQSNLIDKCAPKRKMGVIGREKRFE